MERRIKIYNRIAAIAIFVGLPVLIYALGNFPRRSVLKEAISLLSILAFFIMLMQFYLSRASKNVLKGHKMGKLVKWHKALGYIFVSVLILHPFFIVLPRYFEAGVEPMDAFVEMLSNIKQQGLLLGLIAWCTMLIIGITSFFRDKLPISYTTWRTIHGILSILFISAASFHAIDMGRHINTPMAGLIAIISVLAIAMLLKIYIFKPLPSKKI